MSKTMNAYPSIDKPWLKFYTPEVVNGDLPECTIYDFMMQNNKDHPSDIAINYLGNKITYGDLFRNIDKAAAAFLNAGVKEKEIVTVALPSIPEAIYCVYALNKIGAIANMIHPLAGKSETAFYVNEVKSRIVLIFDGAYETVADILPTTTAEKVIVVSVGDSLPRLKQAAYALKVKQPKLDNSLFQSWKSFISDGAKTEVKAVKRDYKETAIISHTGGTTGEPKGCMVSDYNVNAEIWQVVKTMENKRQQVMMAVLPPFVNYSLVNTMLEPLYAGFTTVLLPKYEPEKFAEYVTKYHVNHVNSIPAYWGALLTIPNIQKYDLSSLGFVFYGGEGMPKDKEEKVNEVLASCGAKVKLQKGLGMTELTSAATATFENVNATSTGIVGIPLAKMIVKAVDVDDGAEKIYGEEGELCITGPTVMLGYFHNKSATDDLIKTDEGGVRWIHTGDLGRINQDGVVRITGRVKRIIMTKGSDGQVTKMFPNRIEKAVHTDDSVGLCCVVGVPDEQRINVPKAYIVLTPGFEKTEETKQKIIQNCKKMLPGYMVPEEIEFRDSLPRTPRGKNDYRALENETQASK